MATNRYLNLEGLERVASKVNQKLKTVLAMPVNPDQGDIVLYKGEDTTDFLQGMVYLYDVDSTYFAWSDGNDIYFTKAVAPEVGDTVYSDAQGTDSGFTIEGFDSTNDEVTIDGIVFSRDETSDVDILDWILQDTSIILNGENRTGGSAELYAPTNAGTEGYALFSNGEGVAPSWAALSGYSPSIIDDALVFTYGILPEVENTSLVFNL